MSTIPHSKIQRDWEAAHWRHALGGQVNHQHFTEQARMRLANYGTNELSHALADCYETLKAGVYESTHPYGIKLWAEIDAIRERQMFLHKKEKPSKINLVET